MSGPCCLCQGPILPDEPRSTFHAIRAYLYKPVSQGRVCKDVLLDVSFRGQPWNPATTPADCDESDAFPIHNRCQATIRRAAKRKGVNAPGTKRSAARAASSGRKRKAVAPLHHQVLGVQRALQDIRNNESWARLPDAALAAYVAAQVAVAQLVAAVPAAASERCSTTSRTQVTPAAVTACDMPPARDCAVKPVPDVAAQLTPAGDITPPPAAPAAATMSSTGYASSGSNDPGNHSPSSLGVIEHAVVRLPYTSIDVDASAVPVPAPAPVAAPPCVRQVCPSTESAPAAPVQAAADSMLEDDHASAVESLMDLAAWSAPAERRCHGSRGSAESLSKLAAGLRYPADQVWLGDASFAHIGHGGVPSVAGASVLLGPASVGYPGSMLGTTAPL